jgi:hypothetical protein
MDNQPSFFERAHALKDLAYQLKAGADIVLQEAQRMESAQVLFKERMDRRRGYASPLPRRLELAGAVGGLPPTTHLNRAADSPRRLGVRQKFASTFMQRQVWPAADIKMHLVCQHVPLADIELLMCAFNRC